ncbi:MAG: hypothetical protein IPL77_14190 [Flavobacteriales bacterium]|nr:hypothetical protein [Flavobacteriales bacterium]
MASSRCAIGCNATCATTGERRLQWRGRHHQLPEQWKRCGHGDNTCTRRTVDFTSCSLLANNQGMWYSFNSGTNTIHYLTLETFDQN